MSQRLQFDAETSRDLEGTYLSPRILARRKLVLEMMDLRPGARVLDIGAGPGFFSDEIAEKVGPARRPGGGN